MHASAHSMHVRSYVQDVCTEHALMMGKLTVLYAVDKGL